MYLDQGRHDVVGEAGGAGIDHVHVRVARPIKGTSRCQSHQIIVMLVWYRRLPTVGVQHEVSLDSEGHHGRRPQGSPVPVRVL